MGFRTISLADDAYERLAGMRRPGESFSDVVRRLAPPRRSLTELFGLLGKAEGDALAEAIEANRRDRLERKKARLLRDP